MTSDIGIVRNMQVITLRHVAGVVGKSERRVRQVVSQLGVGTPINPRLIVLDNREFSRVKRHFAEISKKQECLD